MSKFRFRFENEKELQSGIEQVLKDAGLNFTREHRLDKESCIDFLVDLTPENRVGIEVKILGSLEALTRQLHRYAQFDFISSLILVTSRRRLLNQPTEMNGKPLETVLLHVGFWI